MNQWSFVIAAYLAVAIAIACLIAWSWVAMRQAEAKLDESSGR